MKKMLIIVLTILTFVFAYFTRTTTYAQAYLSDKSETIYNVSNGLLTGKANTICQTEDGYIWIGQYAGLTKYDNKNFSTVTSMQGYDLTSIVALANSGNNLFIGSERGFFVKDENNLLTKIQTNDASLVVKDIKVYGDYAFVATTSGLYKYKTKEKTIERINNLNVSRLALINENNYFYIVGKTEVYSSKYYKPIQEGSFKSINTDGENLYLGTRSGNIYSFELNSSYDIANTFISVQPDGLTGTINDILINDNEIYLLADEGLFYGNKNDLESIEEVKNYTDDFVKMEEAFFDYENNLWLVSSAQGVYKITASRVIDYLFEYDIPKAITYAIEKFHGYTFIGTGNGLAIISSAGKRIVVPEDGYNEDMEATEEEKALMQLLNIMSNKEVRDIAVYKEKIYFATYGTSGQLYYFDFDNIGTLDDVISYLNYDDLSNNLYIDSVDVAKDFRSLTSNDDYLFVGLDKGVARYDGETSKYIETIVFPLYMTINENDLYVVLNTEGVGKVTISEFDNIEKIDTNNTYSTLKCLYDTKNDTLLFTDNNRLYAAKYNLDENKYDIEYINLSLIGSIVDLAIIGDKYYISTEAGVYIVDDIYAENINYNIIDNNSGFKYSIVANSSGYYDEAENRYYYATSSGVLIYDLSNNASDTKKVAKKIAIDSIYVDGKMVDSNLDNIHLSSSNVNLTINFSVLSFTKEQTYTIRYKMNGIDKEYKILNPTDSFQISYNNLSGGEYSFELYTEDFDGTRSQNTLAFSLVKDKRISEHETFWILIALIILVVVVAIVIAYFRIRMKKSIARQNEYKKITLEAIEAIARTIDAKDSYTNGHSKRVGIYSREIARALNLSDEEIDNIYYIALLHDIGKISIPLEILNKPGKLTDEEFEIMKSHTTAGGKILDSISTIPHIVEGAMYHHEKYGGGGYPKGLKGDEIPFVARIICCADCYDAMATRRVYKEPYPKEKIISEFERCSGTQFDPMIAQIVIKLIKEDKLRYAIEEKKK